MKVKVTFKHFPAGSKYIRMLGNGKKIYLCKDKRLPKFLWDKL